MKHHDLPRSETPEAGAWLAFIIGIVLIGAFVYYLADILTWMEAQGANLYHAIVRWF